VVELHENERRLRAGRLPGEETADANLDWMLAEAAENGAALIAEVDGAFAGFAAGWIAEERNIEETPDSNRFGLVSDVCVLPRFRGRRIAALLLDEFEGRLAHHGVRWIRLGALAANAAARAAYERSGYAAYEIVYEKVVPADGRRAK
jgi:ribosomal protein S18 acetylase RimI-like enzyme